MDPQETLWELLKLLSDPKADREEAIMFLAILTGWVERGGFLPVVREESGRFIIPSVDRMEA